LARATADAAGSSPTCIATRCHITAFASSAAPRAGIASCAWTARSRSPAATRERLERIGGHGALIIDWLDAAPLDAVPLGQLADRIVAFLHERREDHQALISWRERNRHALREFWARAPRCPRRQVGARKSAGAGRKADDITRPRERPGDFMTGKLSARRRTSEYSGQCKRRQAKRCCSPQVVPWTKASRTAIV